MSIPFESGATITTEKGTTFRHGGSVAVRHEQRRVGEITPFLSRIALPRAVPFTLFALLQSVALPIHLEDVHMVGQSI